MAGKSEKQKQKLADEITQSVMATLNYGQESVSVSMEEISSAEGAEKVYRSDILGTEENLYKKPGYTM